MKSIFRILGVLLVAGGAYLVEAPLASAMDHSLVVGPDACVDCHSAENDVWAESTHFKTYEELSQSDRALEIAEALEIDDIESPDGTCVGCHFTLTGESADELEPIAGISCESCHGAAANWVDSHGQYPGDSAESENAEQKAERIAAAEAAGQIRPQRIHKIAANCMDCHTVPNESLVNIGGHPAGSKFELVSWLEGEVRHNLFWSNGEENVESSPERKRVVYVVGLGTDLEYSLRALAKSSSAGNFRNEMKNRVETAVAKLSAANAAQADPAMTSMLAVAQGLDLVVPDRGKLEAAASAIAKSVKKFVSTADGAELGKLDGLIPPEGHYSQKY